MWWEVVDGGWCLAVSGDGSLELESRGRAALDRVPSRFRLFAFFPLRGSGDRCAADRVIGRSQPYGGEPVGTGNRYLKVRH